MLSTRSVSLSFFLATALLGCGGSGSSGETAGGGGGSGGECAHHGEGACDSSCACGHHGEGGGCEGDACPHCEAGCECGGHGEHHGARVAEVDALHGELAPVFHQDAGPARATAACEHAPGFRRGAGAVQAVAAPEGTDAAAWSGATGTLVSTADALANECASTGPAVEERLVSFHDAFHAVMDLAGGEHEHGEHGEHGEHH